MQTRFLPSVSVSLVHGADEQTRTRSFPVRFAMTNREIVCNLSARKGRS